MDKKLSKCRFRVMKFDENAVYSSNYESAPKSAKGSPSRAPNLPRRRAPKGPVKGNSMSTKQDHKKNVLTKRNTITDGLKRIFSSTNHPKLNNVRGAHQAIVKVKKTKKIVKDERKKSYLPDYFRRYEDTVTYQCETNKYALKGRNEPCLSTRDRERIKSYSHEPQKKQNRIQRKPSTYFLPAGDSKEGELRKYEPPCETKTSYESCDCLPAEITYPKMIRRECAPDCSMRRVEEGRSFPICHCSSLNLRANRQITKKKCKCCPNKSGITKHPTSIRQTLNSTNTHVDVKTSPVATGIVQKNVVCECPSFNTNITHRTSEKTTQRSKILVTNTCPSSHASNKCTCSALANDSRKSVTCKTPSLNTNYRSSNELNNFRSRECMNSLRSNCSRHSRKNAACECLSSNLGRSSRMAGKSTQCFTKPTTGSVSCNTCNPSQSTKCSACKMSNLSSSYNALKAIQCTDAPPTCTATICSVRCVGVESNSAAAPDKLSYCALCASSTTDQRASPTCRPPQNTICNSSNLSLKCTEAPSAGLCVAPCDAPPRITNVSCGSFRVAQIAAHCGSSLISAPKGIDIKTSCRLRRKSCRHKLKTGICLMLKKKMTKYCKNMNTVPSCATEQKCNPKCNAAQTRPCCSAATSVLKCCVDAETGFPPGPITGQTHTSPPPAILNSLSYIYYIFSIIALIVCSPFIAILYFFRFVTSPIRPFRHCSEICRKCKPPRPCHHSLMKLFKAEKPCKEDCGDAQLPPPKCRVKRSSRSRKKSSSCRPKRPCRQPAFGNTFQSIEIVQQSACHSAPYEKCIKQARSCSKKPPPPKQIPYVNPKTRTCCPKEKVVMQCIRGYQKVAGRCDRIFEKIRCCEKDQPKNDEPKFSCEELSAMPPPPCWVHDRQLFTRPFGSTWDGNNSSFRWYDLCTFIVAAIFWCPLGMCMFIFYRCFRCNN